MGNGNPDLGRGSRNPLPGPLAPAERPKTKKKRNVKGQGGKAQENHPSLLRVAVPCFCFGRRCALAKSRPLPLLRLGCFCRRQCLGCAALWPQRSDQRRKRKEMLKGRTAKHKKTIPPCSGLRCPVFASGVAAPSQKADRCPCSASAVSAAGSASAAQPSGPSGATKDEKEKKC